MLAGRSAVIFCSDTEPETSSATRSLSETVPMTTRDRFDASTETDDGRQSPKPGTHATTAAGAMRSAVHDTLAFISE